MCKKQESTSTLPIGVKMESILRLDGFAVAFKDWSFLGTNTRLTIARGCLIKKFPKLTGLQYPDNQPRTYHAICLPPFGEYDLCVVVTKEEIRDAFVDYKELISKYVEAIDHAIDLLEGTETKRNFIGRCGKRLSKNELNKTFTVFSSDIKDFGYYFSNKFNASIETLGCRSFMCLYLFGQNADVLQCMGKYKTTFDLKAAEQTVLHLARDFSNENHCYFWNENKLRKKLLRTPDRYYPGFVGGDLGNFVFNYQDKFQAGSQGIETHVKAYSCQFKEFHRKQDPIFQTPTIVEWIPSMNSKRLDECKTWIDAIKKYIEDLDSKRQVTARLEVVFTFGCTTWDELEYCITVMEKKYTNEFGKACLQKMEYSKYKDHLQKTVVPALRALKNILGIAEDGQRHTFEFPSMGAINTVAACEILLCFALYGDCRSYTNQKPPYGQLRSLIDITKKTFRNSGNPLLKLRAFNFLSVLDDELIYTGHLYLSKDVTKALWKELEDTKAQEIVDFIASVKENASADGLKRISRYLVDSMFWYSYHVLCPRVSVPTASHFLSLLDTKNYEIADPRTFVSWIFSNTDMPHNFITHLLQTLRSRFRPDDVLGLRQMVAEMIEEKLFAEMFLLLFPIDNDLVFAIVPCLNFSSCRFLTLPGPKQQDCVNIFKKIADHKFGVPLSTDPTELLGLVTPNDTLCNAKILFREICKLYMRISARKYCEENGIAF